MIPIILISLTLHEWGHAFAAHKCGDDTARNLGRMTLNPIAHIDPVGFLSLLLFGFGWAKPVPVNSRNFRNFKRGEAIVSLAGVFMNLLLAILFSILIVLFSWMGFRYPYQWLSSEILWKLLSYGLLINLTLMLFNLIPLYPLDGYHIFELLFARQLPMNVLVFMRRYGRYLLLGLLLIMRLTGFYPVSYLYQLIINGLSKLTLLLL